MKFGVRLPGPFRVGISSSGRVNAGVALGPFSASTGIGAGRRPASGQDQFFPIALDAAVAELVGLGWKRTGREAGSALLTKGWQAVHIEAVSARRVYDRLGRATDVPAGVTWRQVTSRRTMLAWTIGLALLVALCVGFAQAA